MKTDRLTLNRTFRELGLRFEWDEATWGALSGLTDLREQMTRYLQKDQPHLLAVYDADFLARLVEQRLACPTDSCTAMEAHHSI